MSFTRGMLGITLPFLLVVRTVPAAPPALVPFVMPWNDATTGPTDLSALSSHPAGSLGRLTIDANGHFIDGTERIRFWGVNFAGVPAFPKQTDADAIAARLGKLGVNIVRFHHLDATWYSTALIDYASDSSQSLDAAQLDKLERLVSALADHGIYTNFNIQTARIFQKNDGLAGDVSLLAGDLDLHKLVAMIDPAATQLQQKYARAVLTHVNPYRKLTWKDDPAVAIVEILNEQGLLHSWLGGRIDSLPDPWHSLLAESWNEWLLSRYASTQAMASAWKTINVPIGPELLQNSDFSLGTSNWRLEVSGTAQATSSIVANADGTNSALCIDTAQSSAQTWHVQINQPGLSVTAGQPYTVSVRLKAQGYTSGTFGLRQSVSPWGALPGTGPVSLGTAWKDYTYSFMAESGEPNVRFDLSGFGGSIGQVCFTKPSFREGGNFALAPSMTIETGTVPLVNQATGPQGFTKGARADFIEFLQSRELQYFTAMRDFLRNEVGFAGFVGGTAVGTSTPTIQAKMDLVDSHAYWQHPQFPGTAWDPVNWFINNVSMVDSPPGTLSTLGAEDVLGMPHTVSEYNHPAPNTYSSESALLIASFGALQDWDGIYFFDYGSDLNGDGLPDWDTKSIVGFTPIDQHPPKLVNFMQGALLFRKALIAPSKSQAVVAMTGATEREAIARSGHAWGPMNALYVGMPEQAIFKQMRISLQSGAVNSGIPTASEIAAWGNLWASDTSELSWSMPGSSQNYVVIDAPRVKAAIGHIPSDGLDLHGIKITPGETRQNWATVSALATHGDFQGGSATIIVAATGDVENTNQQWKDSTKSSVGNHWGTSPTLVEPVAATIELAVDATRVMAWALDGNGQRSNALAVSGDATHATLNLGLPATTLWYEISVGEVPSEPDAGTQADAGNTVQKAVASLHAAGGGCNCRAVPRMTASSPLVLAGLALAAAWGCRRRPRPL